MHEFDRRYIARSAMVRRLPMLVFPTLLFFAFHIGAQRAAKANDSKSVASQGQLSTNHTPNIKTFTPGPGTITHFANLTYSQTAPSK